MPGREYVIVAPVDITGPGPNGLVFSGYSLSADATGMGATALAVGSLRLSEGDVTLWGGDTAGVAGISVRGDAWQSSGYLTAYGGSAANAFGLYVQGSMTLDQGAIIDAYGGTAGGARVEGLLTLSGSAMANGTGGAGFQSYGLSVGSMATLADSYAQVIGTGGQGTEAYGIDTGRIVHGSGYMYGYGGTGTDTYGINASSITLGDGAQISGVGGDDPGSVNSYGINADSLSQSGYSILSARGGAADDARGINVNSWTVSNPSVYVSVSGGQGRDAYGVYTGSFDFGGSYLGANGGQGQGAAGVYVAGVATQTSGTVAAQAGGDVGAYGIAADTYVQQGGRLQADGGDDGVYGLGTREYTVGAGATVLAAAGFSDFGYGIYVAEKLDLGGRVELRRDGRAAASIYVDSIDTVNIRSSAVIAPVVHLTNNPDRTERDSGLIATAAGGRVVIESGARVDPLFVSHRDLRVGDPFEEYVFIDTGVLEGGAGGSGTGGTITGTFANQSGGLAIEYVLYKNANGQYLISFGRVIETPDLINMVPCENARRLMAAFDDLYDSNDVLLARVMSSLDHANDLAELYRISAHIGRTLTPTAYAKLTGIQLRSIELLQGSVFRRLDDLSERWETWAEALHQRSNNFSAKCAEFDTPKEKITGVTVGVGRTFGSLAVAGAFGYARGTYKSDYTDTGVDNFAATLGAKLKPASLGGWFNPWFAGVAGYAYGDIDQKALNYSGSAWKRSSPSAHMGRASLEAGNDFAFGGLTVAPVLGLDYACIRQGGYAERDPDGLGLRVRGNTYHSLRPRVGLEALWRAGDRLELGVNAHYRYETLDKCSTFDYGRLSAPDVVLTLDGEKRKRFSGSVGATGRYRVNDRVSLWGEYDLLLEDGYAANRFALGIGVEF